MVVVVDGTVVVVVVDGGTVVVVVGASVVVVEGVGGLTVIVRVAVDVWPAPFETVSVYVVVTVGLMVTDCALGKAPIPWSTVALEPVYEAQR